MRARNQPLARLRNAVAVTLVSVAVGQVAAESLIAPAERRHLDGIDRERWQGELYLDEFQPHLARFFRSLTDAATLRDLLAAEFRGVAPARRQAIFQADESGLSIRRYGFDADALTSTETFLRKLAAYVADFDRLERSEIHVRRVRTQGNPGAPVVEVELDSLVVGTAEGNRRSDRGSWVTTLVRSGDALWKMKELRARELEVVQAARIFTDVTTLLPDSYRLTHLKTHRYTEFPANNGVALADWDGDGDLDIYVFRPYLPALFYENDGRGRFRENVPAGLRDPPRLSDAMSGSGYFLDADNDGDLDFLQLGNNRSVRFFRNEAGRFVDATRQAGLARLPKQFWIGAAIADYDLDGYLDLYLLRYADRDGTRSYFDSPGNANHLLHNERGKKFVDVTQASGMTAGNKRISWAAAWGDYNGDGYPDLYVANDFGPNKLYTNAKDGTFVEGAQGLGVEDRANGMGTSWADYDNDGLLDLYVSNMHSYAGARITSQLGDYVKPEQARLAQRFAKGSALFRRGGDDAFHEVTPEVAVAEAGWAWGHVFLDYDNDGDQDLYVVNGYFSNIERKDT